MLRKECSEAVEALGGAPEVVEREGCETFPAPAQVEVVRDRASEPGTPGGRVRHVKVLQRGRTISIIDAVFKSLVVPASWGSPRAIQQCEPVEGAW